MGLVFEIFFGYYTERLTFDEEDAYLCFFLLRRLLCVFVAFLISFLQNLPAEVRDAQEKKLEGLREQQEIHSRLAVERKIFLRDRKIKFFGNTW